MATRMILELVKRKLEEYGYKVKVFDNTKLIALDRVDLKTYTVDVRTIQSALTVNMN